MKKRTIKFRVWDKIKNRFWNPGDHPVDYNEHIEWYTILPQMLHGSLRELQKDEWVLQQFTGLLDSQGVEIFEGDLVNFEVPGITHGPERESYEKAEVWFDEEIGAWSFGHFINGRGDPFSLCLLDRIDEKTFEVVGNVFEGSQIPCPECGGDGKETCSNPDHGFIDAVGGEIGRLGCPVCGHDPFHKVIGGGKCENCNGTGMIIE